MALQDDIFDVDESLKDDALKAAFKRICDELNALEIEADKYAQLSEALKLYSQAMNTTKLFD